MTYDFHARKLIVNDIARAWREAAMLDPGSHPQPEWETRRQASRLVDALEIWSHAQTSQFTDMIGSAEAKRDTWIKSEPCVRLSVAYQGQRLDFPIPLDAAARMAASIGQIIDDHKKLQST